MNLDAHDMLSIGAMVLAGLSAALGLRRHDAKKHEAKLAARKEHGRQTARMAIDSVALKSLPKDLRVRAELDAFRIIDKSVDGKRDFTDAEAAVFLDEARKTTP